MVKTEEQLIYAEESSKGSGAGVIRHFSWNWKEVGWRVSPAQSVKSRRLLPSNSKHHQSMKKVAHLEGVPLLATFKQVVH